MTNRVIHVMPSSRQDRSFGSAKDAIEHRAIRAQRLRGEKARLRGLVVDWVYEDARLAVTLANNTRLELFILDGLVEWSVQIAPKQDKSPPPQGIDDIIRLMWHPLDDKAEPFESEWDRSLLRAKLMSHRMTALTVKETTVALHFESGLVLLCMACRILGTSDYLLYWADQG